MNVLALSLLRLGDLLMHRTLFAEIKKKHPGCTLHVVYHSQFAQIEDLIPEVDVWHSFPYHEVQQVLVEQTEKTLWAYQKFSQLVGRLEECHFSCVYNLTHNFFSARLMDLIPADEKVGIAYRDGRRSPLKNSWLKYMNETYSDPAEKPFHYIEVLAKAMNLPSPQVYQRTHRKSQKILFQVTSSDPRKSWPLPQWRQMIQQLKTTYLNYRFLVLAHPQEEAMLENELSDLAEICVCSMKEAQALLREAELLVSLDTSLIHLAASEFCPILGLYIGCAQPSRTAPYIEGAEIIYLENNNASFETFNQSPRYQTTQGRHFGLLPISGGNLMKQNLSQSAWSFYLNEDHLSPIPPYGTAARLLVDEVAPVAKDTKKILRDLENELITSAKVESYMDLLEGEISQISKLCLSRSEETLAELEKTQKNLQSFVLTLQEKFPERKDEFVKLKHASENKAESAFAFFKNIKSAFSEALHLNMIRARIVQTTIRELTQKGEPHVTKFR